MVSSDSFWRCQSKANMMPRHRAMGADDLMANGHRPAAAEPYRASGLVLWHKADSRARRGLPRPNRLAPASADHSRRHREIAAMSSASHAPPDFRPPVRANLRNPAMQQKKWFAPLRTRLTDVAMRTQKHAPKGQVRTLMGHRRDRNARTLCARRIRRGNGCLARDHEHGAMTLPLLLNVGRHYFV